MALEQSFESAARGYHYYRNVWVPEMGQILACNHEPANAFDAFAIALSLENGQVIGHLPREISRATKFLMDRGARFEADVLFQRYRRSPLVQGGLEIPIKLRLSMRPSKLNERLMSRFAEIYKNSYEDPGTDSATEIHLSGENNVNFNLNSLLPEEAGPKKAKKAKPSMKTIDIRILFAAQREREERAKDTSSLVVIE